MAIPGCAARTIEHRARFIAGSVQTVPCSNYQNSEGVFMSIKFYGAKFTDCATSLSLSGEMEIKCNKCGYKEILPKGDHNFNCIKCPQCDSSAIEIKSLFPVQVITKGV